MSDGTGIAWTDATWNPVTGCSKVSPGCQHCYAARDWNRHYGRQMVPRGVNLAADLRHSMENGGEPFDERPRVFGDVMCHGDRLDQPLRWRKPRRIFVNSMSDLFHDDVPDDFIEEVFRVMYMAQQHQFQVLTKRPERMRDFMHAFLSRRDEAEAAGYYGTHVRSWPPPPNVWLGVSIENQGYAHERVPVLMRTPAAVRFLSVEPLLGPINFSFHMPEWDPLPDWVIVGGESGPKARPMALSWARSIVRQCRGAEIPVFVKQLGARPRSVIGDVPLKHRAGADPSEWPQDLQVQEYPAVKVAG